MPRSPKRTGKKTTATASKNGTVSAGVVAPAPPPPSNVEVLLARFMDIHWGLSLSKRQQIAERMAEIALDDDEEVGAAVNVMAAKTVSEFDKINLGAAKLAFETMLASQAARVSENENQLSTAQITELVGTLSAVGPPENVEADEGDGDEDGSSVGGPSIFDEVARQMAGRSAG